MGVAGVVQAGGDIDSSRWSAWAAASHPRVLAAVAIHPNEAPAYEAAGELDAAIAVIDELAAQPRVRAIGETGLDFFRTDEAGVPAQLRAFEAHIALAKKHDLAMQIHDRDAHDAVLEMLERVGAPERTVFHCFSGDAAMAEIAAERGYYLSFAGNVTFKNALTLRDALKVTPRERILVETDAPFLTPVPHRGRPNAPYLVPVTVRFMAVQLEVDLDELCAQLAANTAGRLRRVRGLTALPHPASRTAASQARSAERELPSSRSALSISEAARSAASRASAPPSAEYIKT